MAAASGSVVPTVGQVILFPRQFKAGEKIHEKWHLIVNVESGDDGYCHFFIIDTNISTFVQIRPNLLDQQIHVTRKEIAFLSHDSVIACERVFGSKISEVKSELEKSPRRYKGSIDKAVAEKIIGVISRSKVLTREGKALIKERLSEIK